MVSNLRGEPLNFGLGRTLGDNYGIVACFKDLYPQVMEAVKKAKEEAKDE